MTRVKPILITGAAGNIGAIGNVLTRLLIKEGKHIRAMVRREDERSESLRSFGAEICTVPLRDVAHCISA
jgi:nucleoside-diphosphate-sugar epimerase